MLEDLVFLWISDLIFSYITTVCETCFTSVFTESTSFCHLWTAVPVQDLWTTVHSVSALLGVSSEMIILMSPQTCSNGSRSGDWAGYSITLILLVWNQDAAAYWSVWGHCLVDTPFPLRRKANLFKYFDEFKRIHDPWYLINRSDTIVWETSPYHDACHASPSSQCTIARPWTHCYYFEHCKYLIHC